MSMEQFKPMTDLVEAICVNLLDANVTYTQEPYKKDPKDTWVTAQSRQGFPAILLRNAWLSNLEGSAEDADNCLVELLASVNKKARLACNDILEAIVKVPEDFTFVASRRQAQIYIDQRAGELSILILVDGRVQRKS